MCSFDPTTDATCMSFLYRQAGPEPTTSCCAASLITVSTHAMHYELTRVTMSHTAVIPLHITCTVLSAM